MKQGAITYILHCLMVLTASVASAQTQVPNTFQAGQPARASEVNENFDALETAIDQNAADIQQIQGLAALNPTSAFPSNITSVETHTMQGSSTPFITVWYGTHQTFGSPGLSQRWANILGNVSDTTGDVSLTYSLNQGPAFPLSIGPDDRRLLAPGDFNVEIHRDRLNNGENELIITATDSYLNRRSTAVTIDYRPLSWPLPYYINWSEVIRVQDVIQVIDGLWIIEEEGLRTHPDQVGYDRVLAIGDINWTDYEVTVPITIHGIDTTAFGSPVSVAPGFGINLRWLGHTDHPVKCSQPHCGWIPMGGSNWYKYREEEPDQLLLEASPPDNSLRISSIQLSINKTYWFKVRVETLTDGSFYRMKVWEQGTESEPPDWLFQKFASQFNLAQGALLIVAHHVDMTVGNLSVVSLALTSVKKLFKRFKTYLMRLPLYVVLLIGLLIALKLRQDAPQSAMLLASSIILWLFTSVLSILFDRRFPSITQLHGLGRDQIENIYLYKELGVALSTSISWVLVLYVVITLSRGPRKE